LARSDVPPHEDGHALVAASGNVDAIAKLLRGSVTNGGLWFSDPECVRQFPVAAKIDGERLGAFAKCLAELRFQPSLRHDPFIDVAVLTYAPGIEVEALIAHDTDGPRLDWIGYAGRRNLADALPTITSAVLESLRSAGSPDGPLDPTASAALFEPRVRNAVAYAWLKVCIDADGAVTSVHPREASSLSASRLFVATAMKWRFHPFVVGGHAIPACAMVDLAYPPARKEAVETLPLPSMAADEPVIVPPKALEAHRISGSKLIVPDDDVKFALRKLGATRLVGSFKLCIDETGHVTHVTTIRSTKAPSYDQKITARLYSWVYAPYIDEGRPTPVCTAVTFIYTQR
jgi:hypothetical protein